LRSFSSKTHETKIQTKFFQIYRYLFVLFILFLISTLSVSSVDLQLNPTEGGSAAALSILVLNGVIVSGVEHFSVALLKDNRSGESLILKIGETLDNFKLIRILDNRIEFQRNNEAFQMYLGQSGIFGVIQKEAIGSLNKKVSQIKSVAIQTPEETVVTKEYSRSYLEKRILAEWKIILEQTEFSTHTVEGHRRGFKLTKLPEGSLLSELGIQRDDIILELNGEELRDKSLIISLIDRFKNDDRGELTIERNGRLIRYEYVLK
jgi:general secretion pathway protein C